MSSAWKSATVRGTSAIDADVPSETTMSRRWARKSKSIWNARSPRGISDVVRPRAVTYSGTFHQWFISGVDAIRTLPTICVHSCNVSRVGAHSATGSAGHASSIVMAPIVCDDPTWVPGHGRVGRDAGTLGRAADRLVAGDRPRARGSRWSTGCGRAGCRWPQPRSSDSTRRPGRACTTSRCCASSAAHRTPRRPPPGRRRRPGVQRRDGADADGAARRERCATSCATWRRTCRGTARVGRVVRALADPGLERRSLSGHCEVARPPGDAARPRTPRSAMRWRTPTSAGTARAIPPASPGEEVPVAIRIVTVARDVELWARRAGWPAAADVLAPSSWSCLRPGRGRRRGRRRRALAGRARRRPVRRDPRRRAGARAACSTTLDGALGAMADFADLKSPCLRGHSSGVAALPPLHAAGAGLPEADATMLGRAALVHDVGRVGVPSGIWDHPGPLSADAVGTGASAPVPERARPAPLRRCSAPLADVAARHHERADGSGYHRGASGDRSPSAPGCWPRPTRTTR